MTAVPLSDNPDELYAEAVARMQLVVPDFTPHGTFEHMLRMFSGMGAEANGNLAGRLRVETLQVQGDLLGNPIQDGIAASSTITVTAIDEVGHTLPAGTRVQVGSATGDAIEAETVADLVIAAGATNFGTVAIQCTKPGIFANDADGDAWIDPLDWLENPVVLVAPFSGGVDPETDEEYGVRLPEDSQLLSVAVSLPDNASVLARRHEAVGWAYTVDHYDATTDTEDLPLTWSTIIADADGLAVDPDVEEEVLAQLEALRETNYDIFVTSPTYTSIDVTCEIEVEPGWDEAVAIANADAAITAAVSPAQHLAPPYSLTPNFVPPRRIYTTDLIAAAKAADGVLHVIPSTFEIGDGSSDHIDLATPIDLPTPGTITVTAP